MQPYEMENLPAYISFEVVAVADAAETQKQGYPCYKDVDFIKVTPVGGLGNLVIEKPAEDWLKSKADDKHIDHYRNCYKAWKEGQEAPVQGTHVKMCPAFMPSQVKMMQEQRIRTVEEMAQASEVQLRRLGIGARGLQERARSWLTAAKSQGETAQQIENLSAQNQAMKTEIEELKAALANATENTTKRTRAKKSA